MYTLLVSETIPLGNGTQAVTTKIDSILKNMGEIFNPSDLQFLLEPPRNIALFHRSGQFIIHLLISGDRSRGQMLFWDCRNDMDTALDCYNSFSNGKISKEEKDGFMEQFYKVGEIYDDVIKNPVLLVLEE